MKGEGMQPVIDNPGGRHIAGDVTMAAGKNAAASPSADSPKILILTTMTSPSGAPMAALRLAAGLAARGWPTRAAFLYRRLPISQVDHDFTALSERPPRSPVDHLRILIRLFRFIRRERPEAVFGFLPLASVLGAIVARLCGVRVRIVSHRVPAPTYSPAMRLLDLLAAWTGCYTHVVAVSRSVADSCGAYPAWLRRRIAVVYNGLKDWKPSPLSKAQARERLGLPRDAVIIAAAGRLEPQKNYPLLIEAMASAPADLVLAIAGDGGLRESLAAEISRRALDDRVLLLGPLPRGEVPHLLAAADLFAQPSLFEGQSNALLEALHAGLPCLVSNVAEQIETVMGEEGAVAGAILPLDDPAAWARAIAGFRPGSAALADAAEAASQQAKAFSFERMMSGFEMVLRRALAPTSSANMGG